MSGGGGTPPDQPAGAPARRIIEAILDEGHAARFTASGDSMHPFIRSGESLLVERVAAAALRRGDVVLAQLPRGLTAHRVVRIERRGGEVIRIVTRGDNCADDDPPFTAADLIGRVRETRKSHKIIAMARHWVRRAVR